MLDNEFLKSSGTQISNALLALLLVWATEQTGCFKIAFSVTKERRVCKLLQTVGPNTAKYRAT